MKGRILLAATWAGVVGYCLLVLGAPAAMAATQQTGGQALEIDPPILTLKANPGQTLRVQIQLRDISKTQLLVTNEINDFVANGEDGTPKILTNNDSNNPFSMRQWVTPLPAITLDPGKIEKLTVVINVPVTASPGGHYGIIRFTGTPPNLKGTGVSLSASLGALVLLTVNGKLTHNLSVGSFTVSKTVKDKQGAQHEKAGHFFESTPLNFSVKLKNSGNIQEQPAGHIIITDMFGKAVAGMNINLPPRNVLPGSTRAFTTTLDKSVIGNKKLFGRYHAVLTVHYGDDNKKTLTASLTFWVIPWRLIVGAIVALIALFFLIRFLIQRYNRRIISKAQGGSRPRQNNSRNKTPKRHK